MSGGRTPSASAETAWTWDHTRVRPDVYLRIIRTDQSGEIWQPTGRLHRVLRLTDRLYE